MNKGIIVSRLKTYQPKILDETSSESAVLLIVVYDASDNLYLVLTKRSEQITYAGDYCFPGGTKDLLDRNFDLAAMREIREELNIGEEMYQMIGQLDDFHDRYGKRVRPFVALMPKKDFDSTVQISNDEITDLYFFPLSELKAIKVSEELAQLTRRSPSYLYTNNGVKVWGLTASIMVHFSNLLFG